MRVTQNSIIPKYQRTLEETQYRRFLEQSRLSTGKDIVTISEKPKEIVMVKHFNTLVSQNEKYLGNLELMLSELQNVSDQITIISDKFRDIRDYSINAAREGASSSLYTIGVQIRDLMLDTINLANMEFNGHYVFSGTKTTAESINPDDEYQNDLPFELIEGESTPENFSGFEVIFKGNLKDRIINKSNHSTEKVNVNADDLFGAEGAEAFKSIINLYNTITFNRDGTKRDLTDALTTEDVGKLDVFQKEIAQFYERINRTNGELGIRINRMEAIRQQTEEENVRLKEFRSLHEDANVADAAIKLSKEENLLQYTLQVGGRLIRQSLLDFLA
jgi:flagellar hook-associated protein 3 FlgL